MLGLLDQEATSLSSSRPDGALSAGKTSMTGAHESALDLVSSTVASLSLRERKHSGNRNLTPPSSSGVEELEMIPSPETWAEPACVSAMDSLCRPFLYPFFCNCIDRFTHGGFYSLVATSIYISLTLTHTLSLCF